MTDPTKTTAPDSIEAVDGQAEAPATEVLVEDVSIDGMCGVY